MSNDFKVVHIPTEVIGTEVCWEGRPKKVKIDIYYDLDGQKIYEDPTGDISKRPVELKECNVKIVRIKRLMYGERFDIVKLYINGSEFKQLVNGYRYLPKSNVLKIDAPWGWG